MELKAKELYRCPQFELVEGASTEGREEITEEKKAQMLTDFPEVFEVIEGSAEGTETVAKKGKK